MILGRNNQMLITMLALVLACAGALASPHTHTSTFSAHVAISGLSGSGSAVASYTASIPASTVPGTAHQAAGFGPFVFGQLVMWGLGLGFAGLVGALFGRAVRNVSVNIKRKPVVFAFTGGAVAGGLGFAFGACSWLVHLPIGVLFLPLKAAVGGILLLFLAFGWVCSMATLGAQLERTAPTPATWFKNAARGLSMALIVNIVAGMFGLGGLALAVQLICALMGCGAAMFSRFGARQLPV